MEIFVDYSRDDRFPAAGLQFGLAPDGLCLCVRWPLLPGPVRPVTVAIDQELAEHRVQVTLIEDQVSVQEPQCAEAVNQIHDEVAGLPSELLAPVTRILRWPHLCPELVSIVNEKPLKSLRLLTR